MPATTVTVRTETETPHGWVFDVDVVPVAAGSPPARRPTDRGVESSGSDGEGDGSERAGDAGCVTVSVSLSWVDYDHVCGGAAAPARVAQALVEELIERHQLHALGARFDAVRADRHSDGLLDAIKRRL